MVGLLYLLLFIEARLPTQMLTVQQDKDEVADIVIDEAPAPIEIDESPSVSDRKSTIQSPLDVLYINQYIFMPKYNTDCQLSHMRPRQCPTSG
jgi:hypothetical protein